MSTDRYVCATSHHERMAIVVDRSSGDVIALSWNASAVEQLQQLVITANAQLNVDGKPDDVDPVAKPQLPGAGSNRRVVLDALADAGEPRTARQLAALRLSAAWPNEADTARALRHLAERGLVLVRYERDGDHVYRLTPEAARLYADAWNVLDG